MTLNDLERPIHTLAEKMRFAKPVKLNFQVDTNIYVYVKRLTVSIEAPLDTRYRVVPAALARETFSL